jgi:antitoxin component YwqK of YwqJK toxin-antitoxin module
MKKYMLLTAAVLFTFTTVAQEEAKKDTYVKKGDKIEATLYHDNGKVSQHGFFNLEGKLHGEWTSYDTEGNKIAIGNYTDGMKTGKWFFWNDKTLKEVDFVAYRIANVVEWTDKTALAVKNK